ncbi:MAG: hypothetical protein K9K35_16125 [Rhodoferax sp.]|jgi:hypothetical protein|nr:hypothetical protein [Rhodoferax sp.]
MTEPAPEPTSGASSDIRLGLLIAELHKMRDALMQLSLQLRDYVYESDPAQRSQVESQAEQAIQRAKTSACQTPRRL